MDHPPLRPLWTREEIWQQVARRIGGTYHPGGFFEHERLVVPIPPWTVSLRLVTEDVRHLYTAATAPYLSEDGFTFTLQTIGSFEETGHLSLSEEIEIGEPRFDRRYRIAGHPAEQVRRLLTNDALRQYLDCESRIRLSATPVPHSRRRIDLTCTVVGAVAEPDRLQSLFELMGETLQHLCAIGSAEERTPDL
ncbi:MAG: hypothetical protein SFU56_22105 [Capsulimonadales bacterium]|nr:hypothetical protein [Capsulimonadales bacterium]